MEDEQWMMDEKERSKRMLQFHIIHIYNSMQDEIIKYKHTVNWKMINGPDYDFSDK